MSGSARILVVDDDVRMAKTVGDILRFKGYRTDVAHSGSEALSKLALHTYDCVLSDIKMPYMNGVELHQQIKTAHPKTPVVLMTAYTNQTLIDQGLKAGILATLIKPIDVDLLLDFVAGLSSLQTVIIIDDDLQFRKTTSAILQQDGFQVIETSTLKGVLEKTDAKDQVILLDMKLVETTGLDVLQAIKKQDPSIPVIIVSAYGNEMAELIEAAMRLQASAYFAKPFSMEKLMQTLHTLHSRNVITRVFAHHAERRDQHPPRVILSARP